MMFVPPDGHFEHLDLHVRMRLESLLTEEQRRRHAVVVATRMGGAAGEIVGYARDHAAIDLIVISTAGRGAVARFIIGSVTDKVTRTAPCPVLTVHEHDRVGLADDRAA
jgi:nucleotide-binding universal stress UspA family protein